MNGDEFLRELERLARKEGIPLFVFGRADYERRCLNASDDSFGRLDDDLGGGAGRAYPPPDDDYEI